MQRRIVSGATIVLLLMCGIHLFISPARSAAANSMWIEPSAVNGNVAGGVGATFNITVWFNTTGSSPGANAWQCYVVYNKTQMNYVGGVYTGPSGSKSAWSGGLPTDNPPASSGDHNASYGYALWGEVLKGSLELSALGSLITLTFQVTLAPAKYSSLLSYIVLDNAGIFSSSASDKNFNDIALTFGDCTYSYNWTTPPMPTPAISPTLLTFDTPNPLPKKIGITKDVSVYLKFLWPDWGCHSVTFDLVYTNITLMHMSGFVIAPLWGVGSSVTEVVPGTISAVLVNPSSTPSGNVLLVTITFMLDDQPDQEATPPYLSDLLLQNIVVRDTEATIPTNAPVNGNVVVSGLILYDYPYLEVSSATMGPGLAVGALFNVTVSAKGVLPKMYFIGLVFRFTYDPALITPVAAYEGPFMQYFAAHQPGSPGTWFFTIPDPFLWPPFLGDMVFPNASGRWGPMWPESGVTSDVVAIITFQVVYQSFGEADLSCGLDIIDQQWAHILDPDADPQYVDYLGNRPPVNGTYTITTDWPGRMLDVYTQYPAPFGGQGLGMPSDMFWPQKEVELYANVTYNYWPVQQKDVAFEIRGPDGALWDIIVARTDVDGVAYASFRIPWPCDHPEDFFGVWTVTVTVDIACIVVNDTLRFHFDYMIEIFEVTTDKFQYNHCDTVSIAVTYGSHAQQYYPLLLYVVIKDELNVPIGSAFIETEAGGTVFCQYKNWTKTLSIHIPKFAFAGIAHVYVTAYNMLPTEGGSAWCPTYGMGWPIGAAVPEIAVQPY